MEKSIVIDLSSQKKTLNEVFWYRMFGNYIQSILKAMFGNYNIPLSVKGNKSQIASFADVLGKEKRYMDSFRELGLNNPSTYRNKLKLNKSISEFERATGIKWPLR